MPKKPVPPARPSGPALDDPDIITIATSPDPVAVLTAAFSLEAQWRNHGIIDAGLWLSRRRIAQLAVDTLTHRGFIDAQLQMDLR